MAGQEITYDAVATAARDLASAGTPVTLDRLRGTLADASARTILPHLGTWRTQQAQPAEAAAAAAASELPAALNAALGDWARQLMDTTTARLRGAHAQTEDDLATLLERNEQAEAEGEALRARLTEREARIERLTIELRHARDIASDALVGKAKDQLAIDGKDAQLIELRSQIERQVAISATESDARLAAEMELVGAVTARNNFAAEVAELRAQLDAGRAP